MYSIVGQDLAMNHLYIYYVVDKIILIVALTSGIAKHTYSIIAMAYPLFI